MKVLVISNAEWDDGNSFGSTFSNILSFLPAKDIANIYCRDGMPVTNHCGRFLRLGEHDLLSYITKGIDFPEIESLQSNIEKNQQPEKNNRLKNFIKSRRWIIFFWMREFLWGLTHWKKSDSLHKFVESFGPDIILLPTYSFSYINKLALYIAETYHLPMVSYVSDDEYSLHQFSFSPLYWLNRFYQRKWIKKGIDRSDILFVISEIQKEEYTKYFGNKCEILTKSLDFSNISTTSVCTFKRPIKILFVGNIGNGRWKSLLLLAKYIEKANVQGDIFSMDVYSGTPLTTEMKKIFTYSNCEFKGFVKPADLHQIVATADILLHVESFGYKERLQVHQSFSTKIVDYLHYRKCIMAIGPKDVASIDFLNRNNAALLATSDEQIEEILNTIRMHPNVVLEYQMHAWEAGRKCCDVKLMHARLRDAITNAINSFKK